MTFHNNKFLSHCEQSIGFLIVTTKPYFKRHFNDILRGTILKTNVKFFGLSLSHHSSPANKKKQKQRMDEYAYVAKPFVYYTLTLANKNSIRMGPFLIE